MAFTQSGPKRQKNSEHYATRLRDFSPETRGARPGGFWPNNARWQFESDDQKRKYSEQLADLPPDVANALQSPLLRSLHEALNGPDNRLELWRNPARHTTMVLGRPVQVGRFGVLEIKDFVRVQTQCSVQFLWFLSVVRVGWVRTHVRSYR